MEVPVSEAKGTLTQLVRRAEAGDKVVLTRHGRPTVALVPVGRRPNADVRRAIIAAVRSSAREHLAGPSAARSQDFLYGDAGLPE